MPKVQSVISFSCPFAARVDATTNSTLHTIVVKMSLLKITPIVRHQPQGDHAMASVFLCHSSRDKPFVRELYRRVDRRDN